MTLYPGVSASQGLHNRFLALVDGLSAVRALAQLPLDQLDEAEFLRQALDALVLHQDMGNCLLFLEHAGQLSCAARISQAQKLRVAEQRLPDCSELPILSATDGLLGLACQSGSLQYCRNTASDPAFDLYRGAGLFPEAGSLLAIPFGDDVQVLGLLCVSHPVPEFFEAWHQHFLILFANLLGRLLHSHRMLHRLEAMVSERTLELECALQESESLRQRYQQLSITDELTGLHNRRYFFAEAESMLARSVRYRQPFSLLLIDVDHFKRINDTLGHTAGDQVLQQISGVLQEQVRAGDLLARLGGEEFVVALPNTARPGTDLMAMRIQQQMAELQLPGALASTPLTVSIGMTSLPQTIPDRHVGLLDRLYREADLAMYRCKEDGRNRRCFYSPDLDDQP